MCSISHFYKIPKRFFVFSTGTAPQKKNGENCTIKMEYSVNCPGMGEMHNFKSGVVATGGEDGIIMFSDVSNEHSVLQKHQIQCDGMIVSFGITKDEKHIIACSDNDLKISMYSYPECKFESIVYRGTVSTKQICVSENYIAVAGEDPNTRVLRWGEKGQFDTAMVLKGESSEVKSVEISKDEMLVATADCDGELKVFELKSGKMVYSMKMVDANDCYNDDLLCGMDFHPTRPMLAVSGGRKIRILNTEDWQCTEWEAKHTNVVSLVKYSEDGKFLVSADLDKNVVIWEGRNRIRSVQCSHIVLGACWNNRALTLLHAGGKIVYYENMVEKNKAENNVVPVSTVADVVSDEDSVPLNEKSSSRFIEDEADSDHDEDGGLDAIKAKFGFNKDNQPIEGYEGHVNEDTDSIHHNDENGVGSTGFQPAAGSNVPLSLYMKPSVRQEPFQSGSIRKHNMSILAWNTIGDIQSVATDDHNVVKIEFVDKANRTIKFNDQYFFSIAALDENGAMFASTSRIDENDELPSYLFYRSFSAWTSQASWHASLPQGEDALVVATGNGWCAVGTSKFNIRIHSTTGGTLRSIFQIPGDVVAMTGNDNYLGIVYHQPGGSKMLHEAQNLAYKLLCIHDTKTSILSEGGMAITPGSTLTWMGFGDQNMLFCANSEGILQALCATAGWQWVPVLVKENIPSMNSGVCANLWHVGVVQGRLLYFALPQDIDSPNIRGAQRPIPSTIALDKTNEPGDVLGSTGSLWKSLSLGYQQYLILYKANIFEDYKHMMSLSTNVASIVAGQTESDKATLQAMKAAASTDQVGRAYDLASQLFLEKSFAIATKIATHFGHSALAHRIQDLEDSRFTFDINIDDPIQEEAPHEYTHRVERSVSEDSFQAPPNNPVSESDEENVPPVVVSQPSKNPFAVKNSDTVGSKRKPASAVLEALRSPTKKKLQTK